MSLYGEKNDYETNVENSIKLAKLLYTIPEENREQATILFQERLKILNENSIFASFKLKQINKKINKLKILKNKTPKSDKKINNNNDEKKE